MPEQEQVGPSCPTNLKWLRGMKSILPEQIWKESKLSKYDECLVEESS